MKRSKVIKDEIAVFPADAANYPAIDRIEVILYIEHHHDCRREPRLDVSRIRNLAALGLLDSITPGLEWIPDGGFPFLAWDQDGTTMNQRLGGYGGRRASNKISATINFNPTAAVARALATRTEGSSCWAKPNFVHPSKLSFRELHDRTIEIAWATIERCRSDHAIVLQQLFDVRVARADVRASVSLIEVAWDVQCRIPALVLRGLHEPWLRGTPVGKVVTRGKSDTPIEWERSFWSDCTLRARYAKGHSAKVYPSSRDTVRYEAQFHRNGQRRSLGHTIRLGDSGTFRADVERLGQLAYTPIIQVQQELTGTMMMPLEKALCAGVDPRRRQTLCELLAELMTTNRVRTGSRSRYAVLCAMRDAGCVRVSKPKGYWEATPEFALALKCFLRFADVYGS